MLVRWLRLCCLGSLLFSLVRACKFYLSISNSEAGASLPNYLELNFKPGCCDMKNGIEIFSSNPVLEIQTPLQRLDNCNDTIEGKIRTNVAIKNLQFPKNWQRGKFDGKLQSTNLGNSASECLNYYAASFRENELLMLDCLSIYPQWMSQIAYVDKIPLKDLFIPGTHGSGTVDIADDSPQQLVKHLKKPGAFVSKDYFGTSQAYDIWAQLVFGIRFLDFSIGFEDNEFYTVNENIIMYKLTPYLQDVLEFVRRSQEVVFLDFHSFPIGFYRQPTAHSLLVKLINDTLGEAIYQRNISSSVQCFDLTIDEIRKAGKNILVFYPLQDLSYPENVKSTFCPSLKRFSSDMKTPKEILNYMSRLFSKRDPMLINNEGWIFEGTHSLEHAMNSGKFENIAKRANNINNKIVNWLRGEWSKNVNIITLDFFSNTNLVQMAITANRLKAFKLEHQNYIQFDIDETDGDLAQF